MKLNPPLLESFIPAFTNEGPIIIPFEMNPSVHYNQVKGFKIKLTNVINDGLSKSYIELNSTSFSNSDNNYIVTVEFNSSNKNLIKTLAINNTYHIQLAYVDHNGQVGLYSTAALVKYTIKPNITIRPIGGNGFEGVYETEDLNEGVYDYQFTITNESGQIIDDSNTLIHDSSTNEIIKQSNQAIASFNGTVSTPKEKNTVNFSSGSEQWYIYKIEQTALYTFDYITTPYTFYILSNNIDTSKLSDSGYEVIYDKCFENMTESHSLIVDSGKYVLINQQLKDNILSGVCKIGSYNLYLKSDNILSVDDSTDNNIYYYDLQGDEKEISTTEDYYALNENNILTSNSFGMEYMSKNSVSSEGVKQIISNSQISVTLNSFTFEPIMRTYSEGSTQDYSWYGEKYEDDQLYLYRKTGIYSKPIKYWYNYAVQLTRPNTYTINNLLYHGQNHSWNDYVYLMESDEYDYFTKNFDATARATSVNINGNSVTITVEKDKPIYVIVCRNIYNYNNYDNEFYKSTTFNYYADFTNLVRPIEHGVYNSESQQYEWHINNNFYTLDTNTRDKIYATLPGEDDSQWFNYSIKAPDNRSIDITISKANSDVSTGSDINYYVCCYVVSAEEYKKCETELTDNSAIAIKSSNYIDVYYGQDNDGKTTTTEKTIILNSNEYLLISISKTLQEALENNNSYFNIKSSSDPLLTDLNHYHYGNLEENDKGESWYPISTTLTSYINLIYDLPYRSSIHLSNLDDNDWVCIGRHSENKFIIENNYSHLRGQSDIYIDARDNFKPGRQLLINTKNENWKQSLSVKFYQEINIEPSTIKDTPLQANPSVININDCIPDKELSTKENYVLIKNIGLDTTHNYKYIFNPQPLGDSLEYTINGSNGDVIYYFQGKNILESADVYEVSSIVTAENTSKAYSLKKNDQLIIVSNSAVAPTITCYGESDDNSQVTLSATNYLEGQVIIDKADNQSPVYYYQNNNSYPQVITFNHVLPEDNICITKKDPSDINLKIYDTQFYDSVNSKQDNYSINVPSRYYFLLYKKDRNIEPKIIAPAKLKCTNRFISHKVLNTEQQYLANYKVSTLNQLEQSTQTAFEVTSILEPTNKFDLSTYYNQDSAYIQIDGMDIEGFTPGMYQLLRSSSKDKYTTWTPIKTFKSIAASDIFFKDYTVEQGVSYRYAYQQYNKHGVYSCIASITEPIYVDFEYMYLGDKDKQIKLSFNSKVTSFKSTLFENKLDTLGGRYPFFFKNGDQNYKEFPISGLLSYHLDEAETFMSREKLGLSENSFDRLATNSLANDLGNVATINQIGYNFTAERLFRLELLDWLNNGQEKLFRSPAEGNYVIRLMNVSLTPNEQLSRLVSEFSATAYECGSAELADIVAAGRLVDTTEQEAYTVHVNSQSINDLMKISQGTIKLNDGEYFSSIKITGAFPSSTVILHREEDTQIITDGEMGINDTPVATYTIGMTGTLDARDLPAANKIEYIPATNCYTGMLECWFTKDASIDSDFDSIVEVQVETIAKTFSTLGTINLENVIQIYTLIVEPTDPSQPAQIKVNDEIIEFNSIQYLDPSSMNITTLSIEKNATIHMYYKTRTKVQIGGQ